MHTYLEIILASQFHPHLIEFRGSLLRHNRAGTLKAISKTPSQAGFYEREEIKL